VILVLSSRWQLALAWFWRMRRQVAITGLAACLAVLPLLAAVGARADDGEPSPSPPVNVAIAQNTTNGSSLWVLAFQVVSIATNIVDPSNVAIATSSCTACSTIAIAIQVVFVTNPNPNVVTPGNAAVAVNYGCDQCTTVALAYQFLVMTGGEFKIRHRGRKEIERIRDQIEALQYSGKTPLEQAAIVSQLMQQLVQVLNTEVVPRDREGDNLQSGDQHDRDSPSPTAFPSPSPSASGQAPASSPLPPTTNPSPSGSPSPSPAPSPSA